MGYYTDYEVAVVNLEDGEQLTKIVDCLNTITSYNWDESLEQGGVKWYDFDTDMLAVSEQFPSLIFTLNGNGEESGDVWRLYYKNGKVQRDAVRVEVIYEPFDEAKLV